MAEPERRQPGRKETLAEVMDTTTDVPLLIEIEDWVILTDRDLSMLGEARHKTIGGRGVVGRLIAKTDLPRAGAVTATLRRSQED